VIANPLYFRPTKAPPASDAGLEAALGEGTALADWGGRRCAASLQADMSPSIQRADRPCPS